MSRSQRDRGRIPACYLAPWVDYGGSDKGTIDWFRWLSHDRFAPLLVTTQPSDNRRLAEIYPHAEEVWVLPELLAGRHMPRCILDLIHTRRVQVLHIMNSRIGFELLPDFFSLPTRPAVVVQLHVEEPDRSGYVRYVATRYGDLVDAFSVSSEHLACAMEEYDIPRSKIRVIPTGVDAEQEFNPTLVAPVTGLPADRFNILFPGRLAEQKDPVLMVDVIRRLVAMQAAIHVHVVGDGPLEQDVHGLIRDAGLGGHFSFHPPSRELARWYAACDMLLMTSRFEGVPYVVYEAMAMRLPIVAPALPGNVELMGDTGGILIDPRDDVAAYAHAIDALISNRAQAKALADSGRKRVVESFSLRSTGDLHVRLYDELIESGVDIRAGRQAVDRQPELLGAARTVGRLGRQRGAAADIGAQCAPGLSVVVTTPVDLSTQAGKRLLGGLESQSCRDIELIVDCAALADPRVSCASLIRRIPPGQCENQIGRVNEGLRMARAGRLLLVGEGLIEMLEERVFIERLQLTFWALPSLEAIAFVDAGERGRFVHRLLTEQDISAPAHALAWRVDAQRKMPQKLLASEGMLAESIARVMSVNGVGLQWRHAPSSGAECCDPRRSEWLYFPKRATTYDRRPRADRASIERVERLLPCESHDTVRRRLDAASWMPPGTELLSRHLEVASGQRVVKLGGESPLGFMLEYDLGAIRRCAPPGTARLIRDDQGIRTVPRGSPRRRGEEELGHLELAPLPLFEGLYRAVLADGSQTLVGGDRDPLRASAAHAELLGYIEGFPNNPLLAPDGRRTHHGLVGLQRRVDRAARRHVYTTGAAGQGELVGELGALHLTAEPDSRSVWLDNDGRVITDSHAPTRAQPSLRQRLRWIAAPLAWRGFGRVRGRARAAARRLLDSVRESRVGGHKAVARPVGYLYAEGGADRVPLFAAVHPVTGDQLLTHYELEAADMGYGAVTQLGYILAEGPATGTIDMRRVSIPWASRFGLEARRQ